MTSFLYLPDTQTFFKVSTALSVFPKKNVSRIQKKVKHMVGFKKTTYGSRSEIAFENLPLS